MKWAREELHFVKVSELYNHILYTVRHTLRRLVADIRTTIVLLKASCGRITQ